jgi:hypothetical protein
LVPPLVGEVGTSSVHITSPSLVVNVTCNPVLPPVALLPLIEVAWYLPAPVARFTSSTYIEPAQSGPYGVPVFGFWHQTQNPATISSVPLLMMGGLETSSDELHPLLLLELGGGVVQDSTIWEAPAAKALGAVASVKKSTITIMLNPAATPVCGVVREWASVSRYACLLFLILNLLKRNPGVLKARRIVPLISLAG